VECPALRLAGEESGLVMLGSTAYGSGPARAGLANAGHTAVIKPGPPDDQPRSAADGNWIIAAKT
jgi:hypothetical protein